MFQGEISVEGISQFSKDFIDGKIPQFYKSESIPKVFKKRFIEIIVGKSFDDIVMDPSKDVLV